MKKGTNKFLKRFTVLLTATAIIAVWLPGSSSLIRAATSEKAPGGIATKQNGSDSPGPMVTNFGSPVIDGNIDEVWKQAVPVLPVISSGITDTTATIKTLWDDRALYILAEIKDSHLSAEAGSVYERDSLEIFLDENNDKTKDFDVDDLQFRVNYKNKQSADHGDLNRFYTCTKEVKDGYLIEARIALLKPPVNNKVLGFEVQINDAKEGKRIATLNLFDKTGSAYADTGLFGNTVLTGKKAGTISGLNPYDLMNLVKYAKTIKLERYTNGKTVEKLVKKADLILGDKKAKQKKIDQIYSELNLSVRNLKHSDQGYEDKECLQVPTEYKTTDVHKGTIERLDYSTYTYDNDNKKLEKYLNVYLPYGYNANDKSKKYNVLYLIHGMGENQNTIFGGPGKNTELMKILDNMIADNELEPMIVVTPTWTNEGNSNMFGLVQNFHNELINDILPLVETKYNTYAASASQTDLIAARSHRAFGGFSMGSGCTWYNYIYGIDYFKYYMPISLYCLADVSGMGYEGSSADQMAQYLASIPKKAGYGPNDYRIFCATGTDDMAYGGMVTQIDSMKKLTDSFIYTADLSKGNMYFMTLEDGTHTWNCVNRYLYNMLPDLFQD
ncbi:sugar-binding protein [Anaerocolumna sp. AGMB13025]|uniref:sugar-binding protein n=1 Tax=Anaerocolumna sp. AGMB13025 TaxID=3039116 RepID=UPI002420488F|nr:sugar-binding protein [Anaerocolumna sp. AGMB13025]WFR58219.1 sugar-binding protein [Anaerocolumna sp. AGMB13025]